MSARVQLNFEGNLGYSAEQVDKGGYALTIADLIMALEEAATEYGEDATIVLRQMNNPYGASYGNIYDGDIITAADTEEGAA